MFLGIIDFSLALLDSLSISLLEARVTGAAGVNKPLEDEGLWLLFHVTRYSDWATYGEERELGLSDHH
jgi:hypothetical protein